MSSTKRKFRLNEQEWKQFCLNTGNPSETLRKWVIEYNRSKKEKEKI